MHNNFNNSETTAFNNWFENSPENKFPLAETPQLNSVTHHYLRSFSIASIMQSREIGTDFTYYDPTNPLNETPRKTYTDREIWDAEIDCPDVFDNTEVKMELEGTEFRKQCIDCKGKAIVDCTTCRGIGKVSCVPCNSNGKIACKKCNGLSVNLCTRCDGKGFVNGEKCKDCAALGRIRCTNCDGGFLPCKNCARNGYVICSTCKGQKEVECETCLGEGNLMGFSNITATNKLYSQVVEDEDSELAEEIKWLLIGLAQKQDTGQWEKLDAYTIEDLKSQHLGIDSTKILPKINDLIVRHNKVIDERTGEQHRSVKKGYSRMQIFEFISYHYSVNTEQHRVTFIKDGEATYLHSNPWDNHIDNIEDNVAKLIEDGNPQAALEQVDTAIINGANNKRTRALRKKVVSKLLRKDLKTKLLPYLLVYFLIAARTEHEVVIGSVFIGGIILCIWLSIRHGDRKRLPTQS